MDFESKQGDKGKKETERQIIADEKQSSIKTGALLLQVVDIRKSYRIGHEAGQGLKGLIAKTVAGLAGRGKSEEAVEVLSGVSFDLHEGEAVRLVGKNGSGKSTLLKILSGVVPPSSGEVRSWGRVASMLEVGVGFHPELSGRANIALAGAILGMGANEIDARFNAVVSMSGIEKFLDTPVKHYSSGMLVRLAVSIALNCGAKIMIADEVLAVADADFKAAAVEKLKTFVDEGGSLIFVSHEKELTGFMDMKVVDLTRK